MHRLDEVVLMATPQWLNVMRSLLGTKEVAGAASNPAIIGMADTISAVYPDMKAYCDLSSWNSDETPWCGLAAANCMALADVRPPFGNTDTKRWGWAKAWSTDPGFQKITTPQLGAVVVLGREGGGHVTFFERLEAGRIYCTGGNQSNAVTTTSFPTSDLIGYYWPSEAPEPEPGPEPLPPPTERRELDKGDTGSDVASVQKTLGIPADGEFGEITETQVEAFQAAFGGDVDGVVGPQTWAEIDAQLVRLNEGSTGLTNEMQAEIAALAEDSALADVSWRDRGKPPPGYIPGMAQAFAVAVLEHQAGHPAMVEAARGETGNTEKDALAYLKAEFAKIGMDNSVSGLNTLRGLFVLLIGLGMRESSGKCYEGRDLSASNVSADTCEAGLFQTSWNIRSASSLIPPLLPAHWNNPRGLLKTFAEGINPTADNLRCYGTGDGAKYQFLARYSPVFATMVTAVGLRSARSHWGPVSRKEVELRAEADVLLLAVQHVALSAPPEPEPGPEPTPEPAEVTVTVASSGPVKVNVIQVPA
jgi:uncharacterized protein (TIGR02594 family)